MEAKKHIMAWLSQAEYDCLTEACKARRQSRGDFLRGALQVQALIPVINAVQMRHMSPIGRSERNEKRSVTIWLSQAEYDCLTEACKARRQSRGDYLRGALQVQALIPVINTQEMSRNTIKSRSARLEHDQNGESFETEIKADEFILNREQFVKLLGWLQKHEPMIYCWAIVQGLCGIRLWECSYLRVQDIDPWARTISITESSAYKPRNRFFIRTIPVPPVVMQALKNWISSMQARHEEGYLFFPYKKVSKRDTAKSRQARAGVYTVYALGPFWSKAMEKARANGIKVPGSFTPRGLRSAYIKAMSGAQADLTVLQRYIGRAPSESMSVHYYENVDIAQMKAIAKLGQDLYTGSGAFAKNKTEQQKSGL